MCLSEVLGGLPYLMALRGLRKCFYSKTSYLSQLFVTLMGNDFAMDIKQQALAIFCFLKPDIHFISRPAVTNLYQTQQASLNGP